MRLHGAVAAVIAASLGPRARAEQPPGPDLWAIPPDAVAWFAFDSNGFGDGDGAGPLELLVEAGLDACFNEVPLLARDDPPVQGTSRMFEAVHAKGWARRFGVFSLEGDPARPRTPRGPEPLVFRRFAAVMDIRAGQESAALAESLDAGAGVTVKAEASRVLVGVSHGVAFDQGGAIDHWLAVEGVRRDQADPWDAHRARASAVAGVPEGVSRGEPVLEAYFDLNALRQGMPDAFDRTRLHRLLREWRLINARSVMVHVHRIAAAQVRTAEGAAPYNGAPLLAIELTWSLRSEPRDSVHAVTLARAEWPVDTAFGLSPQEGACAIVARAEWGTWLRIVIGTWRVSGTEFQEMTRLDRIRAWDQKHAGAAVGLMRASTGWVLAVAGTGRAAQPLVILAPIRPDADAAGVSENLIEVSTSIHPDVRFDAVQRARVVGFPDAGVTLMWRDPAERAGARALVAELRVDSP